MDPSTPAPTATKKTLTLPEIAADAFADFPQAVAIFQKAQAAFSPKPTTAVGWGKALGFKDGSVPMVMAAAADELRAPSTPVTTEHLEAIFGVDPAGLIGATVALGETIEAQVKGAA